MKNNLEVISLIYKSVDYINLIYYQYIHNYFKVNNWDVGFRFIANDATERVINRLKELESIGMNFSIYNDKFPNDYYLNRVYRCWNYAGKTSEYDNICFINSDMFFDIDALSNLVFYHDGNNIPCSRLIESGKLGKDGDKYTIQVDFGKTPKNVIENETNWLNFCKTKKENKILPGGLYMPCIFEKSRFIESGMYPEGNIYKDGAGTRNGNIIKSGDDYFFYDVLVRLYKMNHVTSFNSLVYHIQEGEKDEY